LTIPLPCRTEEGDVGTKVSGKSRKVSEPAQAGGLVLVEPELFAIFPSAEAVNTALRLLVKASRKAVNSKAAKQARAKLESSNSHGDET